MKQVAIVGAGFAGLAAAYFLSDQFKVTLFDAKGVGGGASGAAAGLIHPYPGEEGRRSWHATEALELAKQLVGEVEAATGRPVADRGGIIRLKPMIEPGDDVVVLGENRFLITSGMTIFPDLYLQGLWQVLQGKGVELVTRHVGSTEALKAFDTVVLAAGFGIREFEEGKQLKVGFVKGQLLTCVLEKPLERSVIGATYRAVTAHPLQCYLGATYEREFADENPDLPVAIHNLLPTSPVLECRAGIRVTNRAHYFPIVEQLSEKVWVVTALGSRGLLYHALLGFRLNRLLREMGSL